MLGNIPTGTQCFIDANIFYYHLVTTPLLSDECSDFLSRVDLREVVASTSAVAVAEAVHKVMLADAVAKYGLASQGLPFRLKRKRHLIATLTEHTKVTDLVRELNITVEPVTLTVVDRATALSQQHQLLTNDALTLALLDRIGITDLVTNDDDFDSVASITVWKPR
jgi:predicted nucleic acid-binding protein